MHLFYFAAASFHPFKLGSVTPKPKRRNGSTYSEQAQKNLSLIEVGTKVRWGQEHFQGFAFPVSGQIIKTTLKTMTLRKGLPLLASIRGLVHVSHKDFVEKNEILAIVTDPYGNYEKKIKASSPGYIICVNKSPVVYKGDAILHIARAAE